MFSQTCCSWEQRELTPHCSKNTGLQEEPVCLNHFPTTSQLFPNLFRFICNASANVWVHKYQHVFKFTMHQTLSPPLQPRGFIWNTTWWDIAGMAENGRDGWEWREAPFLTDLRHRDVCRQRKGARHTLCDIQCEYANIQDVIYHIQNIPHLSPPIATYFELLHIYNKYVCCVLL